MESNSNNNPSAPENFPPDIAESNSKFIYCRKCGYKNSENNFKCVKCGFLLHGQSPPYIIQDDNTLGGLIPHKNPKALWAYYLGIFSLIPCFGILLGIAALILGIGGLGYAASNPQARGKVHAWIGIILGGGCAAVNIIVIVLMIISASMSK